jgi:hypothetical protein
MAEQIPDYSALIGDRVRQQAGVALVTNEGSPDEAARTLNNAVKEGVPFAIGNADPQNFNREAEDKANVGIAFGNPDIQRYLANNDFAAAVSKDDLSVLHDISMSLRKISGGGVFDKAVEGFKEGFGEGEIGLTHEDIKKYPSWLIFQPLSVAAGTLMRGFQGTIRGAAEGAREFMRELGMNEAWAARFGRDLEAELTRQIFDQGASIHKPTVEALSKTIQPYVQAGESPQPGVHPLTDQVLIDQAKRDAQNLKDVQSVSAESKTLERSPEAFKAFLDEVARDHVIGVPVDAIKEGFGDRAPAAFEWLPDFERKFNRADASGGDVEIPLKDWLAAIKDRPELAQALKDDIRVREGGLTTREADALKETKPESYQPNETTEAVAKKELWLNPLFKDAKSAGMTEGEFARYSKLLEGEDAKARERAEADAAKALAHRATAEWKSNEARIRDEVTVDLRSRPDLLADQFFREGRLGDTRTATFKLDANAIEARYGKDTLSDLHSSVTARRGGIDPNDAADLFGFRGGEALVNNLRLLEQARQAAKQTPKAYFESLVEKATSERMEAKYGVLKDNILAEAREAVGTGGQANLLAEEMFALMKQVPELKDATPLAREAIRDRVKEEFAKDEAKGAHKVANYVRDVGKAGRQAELALLKGDIPAAFQAKQRQYLAFELMREAQAFKKNWDLTQRLVERYSKNASLEAVDQAYTDQIHALLNSVGERVPRTLENLNRAIEESIDAFISKKAEEGRLIIPPNIPLDATVAPKAGSNLRPFSVEEFRDFSATLQSLDHNGRQEKIIQVGEKREAYETAVGQAIENLEAHKGRPKDLSDIAVKRVGRSVDALMIKMEQLFDWADRNDPNGPFNRIAFRPLSEAEHWKLDRLRELAKRMEDLKIDRKGLHGQVENDALLDPRDGQPMRLDRGAMLKIALNFGNKSNRAKLLGGYDWQAGDVFYFLNKHMTKEDIDFANHVWDTLDTLRPEIEKRTRALSGVAVDLIDPQEVKLANGTLKGGYFPLIEDALSKINRAKVETDPLEKAIFRMLPTAQAVKRRTGKLYPVSLVLDDFPHIVTETVHYLAFAEPLLNARKLLSDRLIRESISDTFGPEYTKQINPWLQHIASDGGLRDETGLHWLYSLSREGRMNVQTMLIGLNPITAMLHGGSALANSFQEVGIRNLREFTKALPGVPKAVFENAVSQMFKSPKNLENVINFVMENSGEVRNRKLKLDDSYQAMWQRSLGNNFLTARASFSQMGMSGVAYLDLWSAVATWKAVYDGALTKGTAEADAIYMADKAVRNAHGASGITDTAAVQRGNEIWRWSTMFMGYFVHNYNRLRDTSRIAIGKTDLDGWGRWGTVAARSVMYLAVPAIIHQALRGHSDKDQSWGGWAANALASQMGGSLPLVRDMIYAAEKYGRHEVSAPLQEALNGLIAAPLDAWHALKGEKVSEKWLRHTLEFPGWTLGLSTREIARAGQFLWDVNRGKERPKDFPDWWRGFTTGTAKERKH